MEREALKLALEAAEIGLANLTSYQSAPIGPSIHEYGQAVHALIEVREAKKALAQPESEIKSWGETHPRNPSAACSCEHWQSCVECRPTAHAQPAQEPVTWDGVDFDINTTPPQRPWVGLTDKDRMQILDTTEGDERGFVMKLVEDRLKEKNT